MALIVGFGKDTLVEVEPGKLTVDKTAGGVGVDQDAIRQVARLMLTVISPQAETLPSYEDDFIAGV